MIRLHPPQTGNKSSQKPDSSSSTNSSRYRHSESHQNEGTAYLSSQKVTDILQAKKEEKKEKSVLIFEMKYQIATSSVLFSFSHFGNDHKKFLSLSFTNVFIYYFYLILTFSFTSLTNFLTWFSSSFLNFSVFALFSFSSSFLLNFLFFLFSFIFFPFPFYFSQFSFYLTLTTFIFSIFSITFVTFLLHLSLSLILFLHSSFFFYQTIIHHHGSKFVCFEAFILKNCFCLILEDKRLTLVKNMQLPQPNGELRDTVPSPYPPPTDFSLSDCYLFYFL